MVSSAGIFKTNPTIDSLVLNEGTADSAGNRGSAVVTVTLNETTLETTDALTLMMMTNIAGAGDVIVSAEVPTQDAAEAVITGEVAVFTVVPSAGHILNDTSFAFASVNVDDGHTAHMGVNIPTVSNTVTINGVVTNGVVFLADQHAANSSMN